MIGGKAELSKTSIYLVRRREASFVVLNGAIEVWGDLRTRRRLHLSENLQHRLRHDAPLAALLAADPLHYCCGFTLLRLLC
jgi:hypothetical protein